MYFTSIKRLMLLLSIALLCATVTAEDIDNWTVRPLANDYYELYRSPDPNGLYVFSPSLTVCPSGRIVAAYEINGPKQKEIKPFKGQGWGYIHTSDDHGKTWEYRTNFPMYHARVFTAGKSLYVMGHSDDLKILRSDDWGENWSDTYKLTENQQWHGSATNVWHKGDYVYMVMERRTKNNVNGWYISEMAPVLMRGDINSDLTKRESWTFASEMTFCDSVNDKELNDFGIPFFDSYYPKEVSLYKLRRFFPTGWLEGNVVQIVDPKHYLYDPTGNTFYIYMRANTGLTNIGCLAKAMEKDDGTIETQFATAPSGKRMTFVSIPGGHLRFHILYDEQSKLYWLLSNQSTDAMTRAELLPKDRFATPDNERSRLQLHFSKNMVDWCFAGLVSISPSETAARNYASMIIDGNDLHILSRSGDLKAKSAHNGNIITFHTIKNFRRLIY